MLFLARISLLQKNVSDQSKRAFSTMENSSLFNIYDISLSFNVFPGDATDVYTNVHIKEITFIFLILDLENRVWEKEESTL